MWLRYCYGIGPVLVRCISHVDGINMGDTPEQYRSNTVAIPKILQGGSAAGGAPFLTPAGQYVLIRLAERSVMAAQ